MAMLHDYPLARPLYNAYLGKGEAIAAAKNLEVVRRMGSADLISSATFT